MSNSKCEIDRFGTKRWQNNAGQYHREDGHAVEWPNGSKEWWINGNLHRLDGPAIECYNGTKSWYVNGIYSSENKFPSDVIQFLLRCNEKTAKLILELLNDKL